MKPLSIALLVFWGVAGAGCGTPLQGQTSTVPGQTTQASSTPQQLEAELAKRPDWTEGWWQLGTQAYDKDQFPVAVTALTHVVTAQPQMGVAWNLLGLSQFEEKDYDAARRSLDRAAALGNSDDPEVERVAAYHRSLLLIRAGDFAAGSALLRATFRGTGEAQVNLALGLAALHLALLPREVDPAREAMLQQVGALLAAGKDGLPAFGKYVTDHPGVPGLEFANGTALHEAGRDEEAAAAWQAESRLPGGEHVAALRALAALEASRGQGQAASAARTRADALGPEAQEQAAMREHYARGQATAGNLDDWRRAMQAYAAGQYPAAIQGLTTWLSAHPEDGTSWAVLGLAEFAQTIYPDALLHLQRGIALGLRGDPAQIEAARYTTGILLVQAGQFERATDLLSSTAKLMPGDGRVTYALGLALLHRAELPAVPPRDAALVDAAGKTALLLADSRYDEAFASFQQLLSAYPQTPFLHYAYGTALIALSEFDQATVQMQAELHISPASALPPLRLASIALRQHAPAAAIAPAEQALKLQPGSAEGHYLLGRAQLETGDTTAAVHNLEQAIALNPNSPEIHFSLAKAYARADNPAGAARERATFAELNALSEAQKKGTGEQTYAGPRSSGGLAETPAARQ